MRRAANRAPLRLHLDKAVAGETGEMLTNGHGCEFERLGQRLNTGAGLALEVMEDPLARAVHTNARYAVDSASQSASLANTGIV
jgi:hypothetical protein